MDVCLYFINNKYLATYLDVLIPRYFIHKALQCIYWYGWWVAHILVFFRTQITSCNKGTNIVFYHYLSHTHTHTQKKNLKQQYFFDWKIVPPSFGAWIWHYVVLQGDCMERRMRCNQVYLTHISTLCMRLNSNLNSHTLVGCNRWMHPIYDWVWVLMILLVGCGFEYFKHLQVSSNLQANSQVICH